MTYQNNLSGEDKTRMYQQQLADMYGGDTGNTQDPYREFYQGLAADPYYTQLQTMYDQAQDPEMANMYAEEAMNYISPVNWMKRQSMEQELGGGINPADEILGKALDLSSSENPIAQALADQMFTEYSQMTGFNPPAEAGGIPNGGGGERVSAGQQVDWGGLARTLSPIGGKYSVLGGLGETLGRKMMGPERYQQRKQKTQKMLPGWLKAIVPGI